VEIEVAASGATAHLRVDDQGPGVPEAERGRIFDPFYRGAGARAGSSGFGLGLPILRRVAEVHGGGVDVSRSPLGGARFELRLPTHGRVAT
jgi:signal transduction histidine kinase